MSSVTGGSGLRERAIALRRSGRSRREIKQILRITSNATLNDVLAGEPPPEWTRRPRAKDDLRAKARVLREQGLDLARIAAELGVSKSSVSGWVSDVPLHDRLSYQECRKRAAEGVRRYWEAERPAREAKREAVRAAAAAQIGALTQRELLIAGAVAYWCEGTKSKPHNRQDRVVFMNGDPRLIRLFLRFLDAAGVHPAQVRYRVYIHENADIVGAGLYWQEVTGADPGQFHRPTLKRHNPLTVRWNVGDDYHGCLRIDVQQSAGLYRQIEGWSRAATSGADDMADGYIAAEAQSDAEQVPRLPGKDSNLR
jgi:predicted transcriptional regulator